MKRDLYVGISFLAVLGALGAGSYLLEKKSVVQAATTMAPMFEVDPLWPKPLPNHWLMGQTIGVSVDAQDHIWIIHRAGSLEAGRTARRPRIRQIAQCCAPAPPVLEFDQAGNLLQSLGRPGQGLRLAGFEPRHHDRLQRQRLDWRQRPRSGERPRRAERSGRRAADGIGAAAASTASPTTRS